MATEQTFTAGPNFSNEVTAFLGESANRLPIYRHMDLPFPQTIYRRGSDFVKAVCRFSGMATTFTVMSPDEFEVYEKSICNYDVETGRRR